MAIAYDSTLANVYATDKRSAILCTRMSQAGFAYDAEQAAELSVRLREAEAAAIARANEAVNRTIRLGKGGGFSTKDLQVAFFKDLKAPVFFRSALTGAPSLGIDAMQGYATSKRIEVRSLALAVLDWRRARKVRVTYIDSVILDSDGRVHPTWLNYGTVSGRFSCQGPNLMNLPRNENDPTIEWSTDDKKDPTRKPVSGGIRTLYRAKPGYVLVCFDASQLEMRMAAYASGDATMIAACESSDLHAANAAIIFGIAFTKSVGAARKALRTLAKSAAFAVCYMAEASTVYARLIAAGVEGVSLVAVEAMLRKLRQEFHAYFSWQARNLLDVVRLGYVESPILGRRRWLGHDPSPTEAANFPIQSGAADLVNERFWHICEALRTASPRTALVAQVHDSGNFEVPESDVNLVRQVQKDCFCAPALIRSSGLTATFPIDQEISERWH